MNDSDLMLRAQAMFSRALLPTVWPEEEVEMTGVVMDCHSSCDLQVD